MHTQLEFLEDDDMAMLIVHECTASGTQIDGDRGRWIKTYETREQMGWDVESLGLVRWDVAQQIRATPIAPPLLITPSFISDPKKQLGSFLHLPMTYRQ